MRHALQTRKSFLVPLTTAMAAAVMAPMIVAMLTEGTILLAWHEDHSVPVTLVALLYYLALYAVAVSHSISFQLAHPMLFFAAIFDAVEGELDKVDLLHRLGFELKLCGWAAFCAGVTAFAVTWVFQLKRSRVEHIEGRQLIEGGRSRSLFTRSEKSAVKATGSGLQIVPNVAMSRQREARHCFIVGSTGSGKTVFIRFLVRQILARNDRALIHDSKGDMLEGFPTNSFVLLAPHDARSAMWNISGDIITEQDAREFAAAMIPESKEPIWSSGARIILTGIIVALQMMMGRKWGWSDLKHHATLDVAQMRQLMQRYYPSAAEYLVLDTSGVPTKIALSFWVTLCAHVAGTLSPLARAWPSDSEAKRFSIRHWLQNEHGEDRHIIMQRAAHLPELSTAWIKAFVETFANASVGPPLPDNDQRRIWVVLDEFAQLGKVKSFQQILEAGRSKGICVVIGIQDPHQLSDLYGSDASKTWVSSFGTKLIFRMTASASAAIICNELVGKRRVSYTAKNTSVAPWRLDGTGEGTTRSRHSESQEIDVVTPGYLESALGWFASWPCPEVRGLCVGVSSNDASYVLKFAWPIEPWPTLRPATIQADWTRL